MIITSAPSVFGSAPETPVPALQVPAYLQFGEKLKYGGPTFVPSDSPTTTRQSTVFARDGTREAGSTEWFWKNANVADWWDRNGTEQGSTAFATATISANIAGQAVTWSGAGVAELMQKILDEGTAGILVHTTPLGTKTGTQFCTKDNADTALRPAFQIVTDVDSYNVGALRDTTLKAQSDPIYGFDQTMSEPYLLMPDLSTVQGTVASATMTLYTAASSQSIPCDYALFALRTDRLITDPAAQLGGAVIGLAGTLENDAQLALQPSVIAYPSFANQAACEAAGWTNVDFSNGKPDLHSFQHVKEYGFNLMRIKSRYPGHPFSDGQTLISWRWPFANGAYQDLWVRVAVRVSPEAAAGINESGVKLPGLNSLAGSDGFSFRAEHAAPSAANPHVYPLFRHAYDATHPQASFVFAENRPFGNCAILAGNGLEHIYFFDFRLKLNTFSGGVWQPDGIDEAWINDVRVYNDTARQIINATYGVNWIDNFFLNIIMGGQFNTPFSMFTEDVGAVCIATQRVGMPPAQSLERDINGNSWAGMWDQSQTRSDMQYSNCYQMPDGRQIEFNMAQHNRAPGDNVGVRYVDYTSDAAPTGGYFSSNSDANISETDNLTTHYLASEGIVYYSGSGNNATYGKGAKVLSIPSGTPIWRNVPDGLSDDFYNGSLHEVVVIGSDIANPARYQSVYNAAHMINPDAGDNASIDIGGGYGNNFPGGARSVYRVLDRTSLTKYFKLRVIRGVGKPTPTHMRHAVKVGNWLYWGGGGINPDGGAHTLLQDHRFFRLYIPDLVNSSVVTQEEITSRPVLTSNPGLPQEQRVRFALNCADKVRGRVIHLCLDGAFVYQVPDDDGPDGTWAGPFTFGFANWAETISEGQVLANGDWHGLIGTHRSDLNQTFFRYNSFTKKFNRIRWAW